MAPRDATPFPEAPVGWCRTHGKNLYRSRRAARRAARRFHPGDHLSSYPCDEHSARWHIGHLPAAVTAGEQARSDITPPETIRAARGAPRP